MILGIDLGTSKSVVAVMDENKPKVIADQTTEDIACSSRVVLCSVLEKSDAYRPDGGRGICRDPVSDVQVFPSIWWIGFQ